MDDILVFGHSVTHGFWDERGGWVQRLRNFLDSRAMESQDESDVLYLYNLSVAGDTSEDLLGRLKDEYGRRTEEEYRTLMLIQIGANDAIKQGGEFNVTEEEFRGNIKEIADRAADLADEVVFVGDFPHDPEIREIPYAPENLIEHDKAERYEDIKKEVCNEKDVKFIDLYPLLDGKENSDFLEEGVHPNTEGHELIFQKVREDLETAGLI